MNLIEKIGMTALHKFDPETAHKLAPEDSYILDSLGWVLFRLGRHEEALEALKKANGIPDYEDSTLLEHQGDVHQALQQADDAKQLWQKAIEVEEKESGPDKAVLKRLREKLGR